MPPKSEITKDKVVNAAFEIVREQGLEAVTARNIALWLNCSTQPIYSAYGNMDELKENLFNKALVYALSSMKQYENDRNAAAMNLLLGCLLFSANEMQLFRMIYLSDYRSDYFKKNRNKLHEELYAAFLKIDYRLSELSEGKAEKMFLKIMTYWLGIGTMINTHSIELNLDEASAMIEEMYRTLAAKEGLYSLRGTQHER